MGIFIHTLICVHLYAKKTAIQTEMTGGNGSDCVDGFYTTVIGPDNSETLIVAADEEWTRSDVEVYVATDAFIDVVECR